MHTTSHLAECLICGAPLVYLPQPHEMQCSVCRKTFVSNVHCEAGHFVCDDCHTGGVDAILRICRSSSSADPMEIVEQMMSLPTCHMHGPEHHIMVGAALLCAFRNAGGQVDLAEALPEMVRRARQVPGGACGNWGACGAAISTGMFVSIVTGCSPLATEAWSLSNAMTSHALAMVSRHGGPRCCKRDSFLSIMAAADFVRQRLGVEMILPAEVRCSRSALNKQCLGATCPFNKHAD